MNDDEISALRAMVECVNMARDKSQVCYMYKRDGKGFWGLSYQFWDNWLFKAYPGGRKILSVTGKTYMEKNNMQGVVTYLDNMETL